METNNWKEFKIGNLFDVTRGKRIVKTDYVKNGPYPVITATTSNNSVDGYYSKYNSEGNILTIGGEASGFFTTYQENRCWVMDRSRICIPLFKDFNKFHAFFLIPLFNKNRYKYNYGRSANPEEISNTVIKLPSTCEGKPDWEYMENYIKSLHFSKYI